jgi:hypothetical protein
MSVIWDWDRKAQDAFEHAKILVGETRQLCVPLPQCPFLLEVTIIQTAIAGGYAKSNLNKLFQLDFGLGHEEERKLCTQQPL